MPHRRAKKPRGSRGVRHTPCIRDGRQKPFYDLMVALPKASTASEVRIQSQLLMKQVAERLASTGYATMAFAHVVYGRPRIDEDKVNSMLELSMGSSAASSAANAPERPSKRSKLEAVDTPIRIVKRLHAVVENLSDVGVYTRTNTSENAATLSLLQGYDLVSLAPRNDATFQAACSASEADIVTLDYTAGRGGIQLPFRIRPLDVRAVVQRAAAFEIHYAPALLHLNQRKALVQTARMLEMASVGVRPKPRLLFSSGDRTTIGDSDVGAMALRSPGDLINLLQTVLKVEPSMAHDALGASGTDILKRGELRQLGQLANRELLSVHTEESAIENEGVARAPLLGDAAKTDEKAKAKPMENADIHESRDLEDGFITL